MEVIKSFFLAFSMYSRIPMPQLKWKEEDMKYALCFFPWVGAVIGGLVFLWGWVKDAYGVGDLCYVLMGGAIPLLVTGGIHVDGFMDAMDAFHSFQTREKKLEIMKDPHIGAFSVLALATCGFVYLGALSEITDGILFRIFCAGFFLARCLSGIGAVTFPAAKKEGMLYSFAGNAEKRAVRMALYGQTVLCVGFMLWQSVWGGGIVAAAALAVFAYYRRRCQKELGGITGDTAGWFTVVCETGMAVAAAFVSRILG